MKQEKIMAKEARLKSDLARDQQDKRHAKDTKMYFWTLGVIVVFVGFTLWYFT
jgi:hypothetical protein